MNEPVPGRYWQAEDGLHVDTRGLGPPDPMVAILWHLEQPGQTGPVTAYLDRYPVNLFPELVVRRWQYEVHALEEGQVRLVLRADT